MHTEAEEMDAMASKLVKAREGMQTLHDRLSEVQQEAQTVQSRSNSRAATPGDPLCGDSPTVSSFAKSPQNLTVNTQGN